MNCVQGDWAISRKTLSVVRCIRFIGKVEGWRGNDRWETDKPTRCVREGSNPNSPEVGDLLYAIRDSSLIPLRGTFEEIVAQVTAYRLTGKIE